MRSIKPFIVSICAALTALSGQRAIADDTEVFFSGSSSTSSVIRPNILLILDTSGSMNRTATFSATGDVEPYDNTEDYSDGAADCNDGSIYFWPVANGTAPTSCSAAGLSRFDRSSYLKCKAAVSALDGTAGYYGGSDTFIRLKRNSNSNYSWQSTLITSSDARDVECRADAVGTIYGESMSSADNKYPKSSSGNNTSNSWTTTAANSWWNTNSGTAYYLFSPNYIRYNNNPPTAGTRYSRMDVVKTAVSTLLNTVSNVNVGLMRYDSGADGGMVVKPIAELTSAYKDELISTVNNFQPSGNTPLSETLYEAYRYLSGGDVSYGATSTVCSAISNADDDAAGSCISGGTVSFPSVAASLADSNTYDSPLDDETTCSANNHIIYLTDGLPTSDSGANTGIASLTGTTCTDGGNSGGQGICLEELSTYMKDNDLAGSNSTAKTHYIGFGSDVVTADAVEYLQGAATAGGGQFHTAGNVSDLATAFNAILNEAVADTSATFVSPSVAVNSFNKTQILEDMYVAMFKPTLSRHWPGNLKKFKLREVDDELTVVGQGSSTTSVSNVSAVDPDSGFFKPTARDMWQQDSVTNEATKDITTKGGAAKLIPLPANRKLYTYLGGTDKQLSATANLFNTTNKDALVSAGLGTTDLSSPTSEQLINWARGQDINNDDNDSDGDTTDARGVMGDPIHSQPAVVIYGNDSSANTELEQLNDARVYVTTNDGYLHAIDVVSGEEKWAFIPNDLINQLLPVYENAETLNKEYTLDGDIRVLKYDVDGDGIVDTGTGQNDRVILYFSQGRGGPNYYALDVTEKDNPKFLWKIDSTASLGGINTFGGVVNKSWSTPTLGRVNTGGTQNPQKLVLIFGGGYDITEDSQIYNSSDAYGKAIFMVDAIKGSVLWRAGATGSGADLELAKMTHAIPSNVTVLDVNGDGWSDRMYVGDMAGQLWRFDITSYVDNTTPVSDVAFDVNGGVIASLGHQSGDTGTASNRSFYNSPDVAKITVYGAPSYYNIAIGSGDRALPKTNTATQDRFYAVRDYRLSAMSQASYEALTPILDSDLTAIDGTNPPSDGIGSDGWKLEMSSAEKVLSSSITLDGVVMFTTFLPAATVTNACLPTTGSARSYTLNVTTGIKYFTNLYETFATTGLPSQVNIVAKDRIVQTGGDTDTGGSSSSSSSSGSSGSVPTGSCLSGVTILGNCVDFGTRVKTFWQEWGAL